MNLKLMAVVWDLHIVAPYVFIEICYNNSTQNYTKLYAKF